MKNLIKKVLLAVAGFYTVSGLWGCAAFSEEEQQVYTPICLYFDPLNYGYIGAYAQYFPLFENYPTDWAKCGLKNYPKQIDYYSHDETYGNGFGGKVVFNQRGQLLHAQTLVGNRDYFGYDEEGRYAEVKRFHHGEFNRYPVPQYQDALITRWFREKSVGDLRNIFTGIKGYDYSYYPDGTLKTLVPQYESYVSKRSELGTMEFDEKGLLRRMEAPFVTNPFLKDVVENQSNDQINCISTFEYDGRGLCIEKEEKFFLEGTRSDSEQGSYNFRDTIVSVSRYEYNSHGDLIRWTYDGGTKNQKYGNSYRIDKAKFALNYGYKYDDKGNWIEMTIEMPANFKENYVLARYCAQINGMSYWGFDPENLDFHIKSVFCRKIDGYFETDYAGLKKKMAEEKQKAIEEEKKQKPKYTGVMAYGLQGKVKSVTNDSTEETITFNKIGNIESQTMVFDGESNTINYVYETPFRYKNISGDMSYRIDILESVMKVINENEEEIFEFENEYEFDSKGRVIKYVWFEGMAPATLEFFYNGDSRLPYKEVLSGFDEYGNWSTSIVYKYDDVDKHGNWIKRTGTATHISTDYEEVMNESGESQTKEETKEWTDKVVESRKITYY